MKLGCAGSIKRRYFSYLTGDPHRAYRMLAWSDPILDLRQAEKELHLRFESQRVDGSREWFRLTESQALAALNTLRRVPMGQACAQPEQEPDDWYAEDGTDVSSWA